MRENPKTQDSTYDLAIYVFISLKIKTKMILWSIHTFWYKGPAENKGKKHVRKKDYISQKQQPKPQSMIFQKSRDMIQKS